MKKRAPGALVLGALLAATSWSALAPTPADAVDAGPWDVREVETSAPLRRSVQTGALDPAAYAWLQLDQDALEAQLVSAPLEGAPSASPVEIEIPSPSGELRSFDVYRANVFAPGLAERFPDIGAYVGTATDGSGDQIRFEVTPSGFRAQVSSTDGWWYVDPRVHLDTNAYVSYYKSDLRNPSEWSEDPIMAELDHTVDDDHNARSTAARSNGTQLRTYRLAVVVDEAYSNFHDVQNGASPTIAESRAGITTAVNRLNGIYEPELSIRFQLIDNDDLIFLGPGAPTPGNLTQIQTAVDGAVANSDYDIGHMLSGGFCGLASPGVGVPGVKARGCSGLNPPADDPFVVDYVAHEIGHQFDAEHTFNACESIPDSNRVAGSAYEPGSASTILGYAGICFNNDVQIASDYSASEGGAGGSSDPYFHSQSFEEIVAYTTAGEPGDLGASINLNSTTGAANNIPSVDAGADGTIPDSTPFRLTGTSSDSDLDPLVHRWEQRDLGQERAFTSPQVTAGPLFRSRPATASPSRFFPTLSAIAAGNTNLATTCPTPPGNAAARQCWSEYVPDQARTMNFRMTVLDGEGGVNTDDLTVTVVDTPDPFVVTAPNGGENAAGGSSFPVEWNVAGTATAPINTATVNIRASLDDGDSYPYLLLAGTPNDGSQSVTLPGVGSNTSARIMVESSNDTCGVHFFDVSNVAFTITTGGNVVAPPAETACTPSDDPPINPPSTPTAAFESLSPERFVDTRASGETIDGQFENAGKLPAGFEYRVTIAGRGQVPTDAKAAIANVTAVQAEGAGFITVHPCASPLPLASSLNYTAGVNLGNEIVAPLTDDGDVCIYTFAPAHITVDVTGYVPATSTTTPITPKRFLDTRPATMTFDRESAGVGKLLANETEFLRVAGRGDVPVDAVAVIINVTAVQAEGIGFVTVDPCAQTIPNASSLNYVAGVNRGNELIASIDSDGDICLFTSTATHLTADVVGYLPAGTDLSTVAPARLLDSRPGTLTADGTGAGIGKLDAGEEYVLQVTGRGGVDDDATSAIINVTAVAVEDNGFITVHPCASPRPVTSSLNYVTGINGGNEIIARLTSSGTVCLYTSARAHLTVDVVAYNT